MLSQGDEMHAAGMDGGGNMRKGKGAGWAGVMEFLAKWPVRLSFIIFAGLVAAGNLAALGTEDRFSAFLAVTVVAAVCFLAIARAEGEGPIFILGLMAVSLVLHTVWAILLKTQPVSDFQTLFDRAVLFANGNLQAYDRPYFHTWAYQTAFSLYEALSVKIFGSAKALVVLKILNGCWISLTNLMIYLLAKRFTKEKFARVAALMYFLYAGAWSLSTVLTNQFMGTAIMLCGVLLCLGHPANRWYRLALGGMVLGAGNAFRSDGIVWAVAVALALILLPGESSGKASGGGNRRKPQLGGNPVLNGFRKALLILVPFFATGMLLGWSVSASGVNPAGLGNGFPEWKFIEGLNDQSEGQYSQVDNDAIFVPHLNPNVPEAEKKQKEAAILKERWTKTPEVWRKLIEAKFHRIWVMEGDLHWAFSHLEGKSGSVALFGKTFTFAVDTFVSWLMELERGSFLLVVLFSLFGALPGRWGIRREEGRSDLRIPLFAMLLLLAMAVLYLFVEVQLRYRISFLPVFFILAAPGMERLVNLFIRVPSERRGELAR